VVPGRLAGRKEAELASPGHPRTWYVDIPGIEKFNGGSPSIELSSRRFRRHSKILLLRIGDWATEQTALNPLAQSLRAQMSLLLPPGEVDVEYIRTLDELAAALRVHGASKRLPDSRQAAPWGYAILIGHGRAGEEPALRFGDTWRSVDAITQAIKGLGPARRSFGNAIFISLCCETGQESFAKAFSDALNTTFVGPGAAVHSFEAAATVQWLFLEHFLHGCGWADAFRHTAQATAGFDTQFRFWADGVEK